MADNDLPVAVIGAGFSGTITALQLARRISPRPILLCGQASTFARGTAYSTKEPIHLLNVRATNMSAFPDQPGHFVEWLGRNGSEHPQEMWETPAGTFVSRNVYGRYLASLLTDALKSPAGAVGLKIIPDMVTDLRPTGQGFRLSLASGRGHEVSGAILAVGSLREPQLVPGPIIDNPWTPSLPMDLVPGAPVVIIGTGLTMVDVTMHLWQSGFAGPVVAISRRGLTPSTHVVTTPWPMPELSDEERRSVLRVFRRVRSEIAAARRADLTWHSVIDSLRPITSRLWRDFPETEQRRFLRHLRRWWDVHRHRMAPSIGEQLQELLRTGFLEVVSGSIRSIEADGKGVVVAYTAQDASTQQTIRAQKVIRATGYQRLDEVTNPVVRKLVDRGLVRLDRHHLGLDVTDRFEVIGKSGAVTPSLWALGPIVNGAFWECTAVPDIRVHAQALATQIAEGPEPSLVML
jgi:uncharacterized NAD(P)/FAD-binding protein YdhS